MRKRPVRRTQLIAPFGPGGMMVAPDGTSLIAAGLDHWFTRPSTRDGFDPTEFQFHEWRLEREVGVDYFALPPDYRERRWEPWLQEQVNTGIKIPFLRFPQWHVCPFCGRLECFPLEFKDRARCPACEAKSKAKGRKSPLMVQVRFIAICEHGHIQDFPWREWVHRSAEPVCRGAMKLSATGGASLAATRVSCECGATRTLEGITQADPPRAHEDSTEASDIEPSTTLTRELAPGQHYLCQGRRPWLGDDVASGCSRPLRGSLRGATNVYFAITRSAIYLPRGNDAAPKELTRMLEEAPLAGALALLASLEVPPTAEFLKQQYPALLRSFTNAQVTAALAIVAGSTGSDGGGQVESDDSETAFRRAEFAALRAPRVEDQLQTRPVDVSLYDPDIGAAFSTVVLVEKLRETRALTGFARVFAENDQTREERKALLWRDPPDRPDRWLPAYQVFGEGIYLELNEERLRRWERRDDVRERARHLAERYRVVRERRRLSSRSISARFVLIHTLAHLLMNQLIFDCGYGSASLRERLYVSAEPTAPMAGVLIYTAAGDSDGTMGGLVRMGKSGSLEMVVRQAIDNARWCSSDPVCMELGASGGQGPDSCNLAACHNCALVPETSCEEFNKFLDRWLVVGDPGKPDSGFFAPIG